MTFITCVNCGKFLFFSELCECQEQLGNNGEPIKNINPEVCEDQVEKTMQKFENILSRIK